jgi:dephospho-CoA kinase
MKLVFRHKYNSFLLDCIASNMLVGLCGEGGSGKDSVAAVFTQEFGFIQKACADGVRREALEGNAFLPEIQCTYREILERLGYEEAKRQHPCVRQYLIDIGHGKRLMHGENYWLDQVATDSFGSVVLSDVRYLNEAQYCNARENRLLLRIRRPGYDGVHETERKSLAEIPEKLFHHTIVNDGTLEQLREKVRAWIRPILSVE